MKNIKLVFLLGFSIFLSFSCTKEEPKDQEYVRCLFNGEEWEDCCDCPNPWGGENGQNIVCKYKPGGDYIRLISGNDCSGLNNLTGISILSRSALNGDGKLIYTREAATDISKNCKFAFNLDTNSISYLLIDNYDIDSRIIEGTFGFTAVDPCGNIVEIKEGVFRVPFTLP